MDDATITIRKYTDYDEMKADEFRYWQGRPAYERLDAVEEMIETAYASRDGRSSLMYRDYKDLLSAFQSHGVKYLVVVGFAVIYHLQPRFTKDLDLFIKADLDNAKATYAALAEYGVPLQGIRPEDLTDPNKFFRFGRDPKSFDLLPSIPGVDFDAVCIGALKRW
jgi:hypothetical protein